MKRRMTLSIAIGLTFFIGVFAQSSIQVGDTVEYRCNCFGKEWISAKVEGVDGNTVRVRYGNMRNQVATVNVNSGEVRTIPKPDSPQTVAFQEAFRGEALNRYISDLQMLAPYYDEQFNSAGGHNTMAAWQEMTTRLGELDVLCNGKYAGVTNTGTAWLMRGGEIDYRYADWCKIAANRVELVKLARTATAARMSSVPGADDLKRALEYEDNRVVDDIQLLMYEPDKWKAQNSAKMKPHFATYGVEMPANFFDDMLKKAAELKAKIDAGAPLREFETSATRDAAVENFIKGKFITEYPGSQILKSRVDYPNWVKRESLSLVGSGTGYKLYKVEYNFYKRGWVLIKMPNRPYCQAREWIVGRGAKGLVAVSTSSQGTFMKCQ